MTSDYDQVQVGDRIDLAGYYGGEWKTCEVTGITSGWLMVRLDGYGYSDEPPDDWDSDVDGEYKDWHFVSKSSYITCGMTVINDFTQSFEGDLEDDI